MINPTMLYKLGGEHLFDGKKYSYIIVAEEDIEEHLKEGWHLTTKDAQEQPTREELEIKAKELGIQFDGRTSDKKLLQAITDKLGE